MKILAVDISGVFSQYWEVDSGKGRDFDAPRQSTINAVRRWREGHDRVAICCDSGKLAEVNASMGGDQIVTASEIPKSSNVKGVLRVIVHDKDKLVCGGAGVSVLEVEPARDPSGSIIPLRYKVIRRIPPSEWQD